VAAAALAARVVEVIADLGGAGGAGYRYGSGCIVRGRTVLTAAHVVAGAVSVVVRDPGKREYTVMVDPRFVGDVDGPGPDLALVEIDDPAFSLDVPGIGLAAVDRDSTTGEPVERCHAVGYPWFAEARSRTRAAVRDTVDAIGVVPVLSNLAAGLLSVQVTVAPRELPPEETALTASEWSGMSGAPVFAGGRLLGVVTEHAPREGPSAITAVPLTALQADPSHEEWGPGVAEPAAWWARLGVEGIGDLRRLPVPPPPRQPPEYWSTLRERIGRPLHQRMPQLLGRDRELTDIAAFATGSEGYRWLVGAVFTGKTALLYEAVTVGLPDEVDVVCYFLSGRASVASSERFLAAVVPQLAYLCEVDPPVASIDRYHALWEQAATRAEQSGRHLLLVVDGLDEDDPSPGLASVASLLPALAGAHAHVLVSSRPYPDLPYDVPDGHPLRVAPPVQLAAFEGAQKLAELAEKEIYELTHGDDSDLAVEVLGLLTAAAGPLSVGDLAALRSDGQGAPAAADRRHVRRLVEERAARSLERVGRAGKERYQFAHGSLLEYAQIAPDLSDPEFRQRIHHWASRWRGEGWPGPAGGEEGTPRYLLDTYPATLGHDPHRLAELACDIGWVEAAIRTVGVDQVLAVLRTAAGVAPADAAVAAMLTVVAGQARNLRSPGPVDQPGFAARQMCLQATESGLSDLADAARSRACAVAPAGPVLVATTRRAALAHALELGSHDQAVRAVTVSGARVVSAGDDGRLLVWDPAAPGTPPAELANHTWEVTALAALSGGRVISGGKDRRLLVWDPVAPGTPPVALGRHSFDRDDEVTALAALGDGRVVSAGDDGRLLVWDPEAPGTAPVELDGSSALAMAALGHSRVVSGYGGRLLMLDAAAAGAPPVELGRHDGRIFAVAVLGDGRVVSGGDDRRLLVWDPDAPGTAPVELGIHDDWVMALAVAGDGRVISTGSDGRVLAWDPAAAGAVPKTLGRSDGRIKALEALGDGRVVSGGYDGRVLVWDPAAAGAARARSASRDVAAATVAVLANGCVVAGGKDGSVWLWDPAAAPDAAPVGLGCHDDSSYLRWIRLAALSDGRIVSSSGDGRVLLWDPAAPGTAPVELGDQSGPVLAVSGDRQVISAGNHTLLVWDPAGAPHGTPVELGQIRGSVNAAAVLRDGRLVSAGSDGTLRMWDPAAPSGPPVELGFNPGTVVQIAVRSDGRLATGDFEGAVRLWDPATPGTPPVELGRHNGWVTAVAVLGDGRVVSGGQDGRLRFWDPAAPGAASTEIACSVQALSAHATLNPPITLLVIADEHAGLSAWTIGART
jgi:WD40 repeat protein